jgi:hypothetical protein
MAALRFFGDDLDPTEITRLLGAAPSMSQRKGDVLTSQDSGRTRTAKFGSWILEAGDRQPEDLDGQIGEILGKLTPTLAVWSALSTRYRVDLFCGLEMRESNEGVEISTKSLVSLGERGIKLGLDVYSPSTEELQAQGDFWSVRGELELMAELLELHKDASSARVKSALDKDEQTMWIFLVSDELWGGSGSVADQALIGLSGARRQLEELLIKLGRAQMRAQRINARTEMWVRAFEQWASLKPPR